MFTTSKMVWSALMLTSLAFISPLRAADEHATPEQLQELRGALADGYAQRDNKMIDLSVKGFTAAGQKGPVLDETIQAAQLQAAMQMLQPAQRVQLEVLALYSRARSGNADALQKLVEIAGTRLDEKPQNLQTPEAYKLLNRINLDVIRVSHALDAFENLQYKDTAALARIWLSGAKGDISDMGYGYMVGDSLMKTCVDCLLVNRAAGLKELEAYVVNPAVTLKTRINVCRMLTSGTWKGMVMQPVPEDVTKQFSAKIPVLIDAMDNKTDVMTALNLLYTIQQLKLGEETMSKMEDFAANRANESVRQNLQTNMRFNRQAQAAKGEKPKLPPKETPDF